MGSAAGNGIDSATAGVYGLARDRISEREIVEWREQTNEGFRYKMFDGDHSFLRDKREQLIDTIMRDPRALSPAVLNA